MNLVTQPSPALDLDQVKHAAGGRIEHSRSKHRMISAAFLNKRTWAISLWQLWCRPAQTVSLEPDRSSRHVELGIGDMQDECGRNLFILKDELIAAVARELLSRIDLKAVSSILGSAFPSEHVATHLIRRVNSDLYVELGRYCMLAELAQGEEKAAVLIERSVYASAIKAVFEYNADVRIVGIGRFPWADLREVLASVKQLATATLFSLRPAKRRASVTVAVQATSGSLKGICSELAWLPHSGLNLEDVVLYSQTRLANPELRIENLGNWTPGGFEYWRNLTSLVVKVLRISFSRSAGPLRTRLWLVSNLLMLVRGYAKWLEFFNVHNVKMHHHISDSDDLLVAKLLALQNRNGLDLSFQFSASAWILPTNSRPLYQEQFMAWGPAFAEMVERCEKIVEHKAPDVFFFIGHPYHAMMNEDVPEVEEKVEQLRNKGCSKIILVLDSQPFRDFFVTEGNTYTFYESVIRLAALDPSIGLVLKPQYEYNIRPELAALIASLGPRACRLKSKIRPFQIFRHVDMAVGLGAHNSAIVEAAIAGVPFVFYDVTNYTNHLFYERIPAAIVRSEEVLAQAIKNNPGAQYDPRWFDPYRDQKGHERMGRIIRTAFDALRRGGSAKDAVTHTESQLVDVQSLRRFSQ